MIDDYDEKLNQITDDVLSNINNYENRELKGFRRTIQDDVKELLLESNPKLSLNNQPTLTIIMVLNVFSQDPCNSCQETLDNVLKWCNDNDAFDGELRLLLVDSSKGFGDQKMWSKLNISFNDVPLVLFFDKNQSLIDIVQGVTDINYLNLFWSPLFL